MPPKNKDKKKEFKCTDNKAKLPLNIANDLRYRRLLKVWTMYSDVFVAALPDKMAPRSFPHKKEQIINQLVSSKLKAMRPKFRRAVDSSRREWPWACSDDIL